jgi:hypothetical protein
MTLDTPTPRKAILARLGPGASAAPLFLPDLTLWHRWHSARGTLPGQAGSSLADAAASLSAPVWAVCKPWDAITPGVETTVTEADGVRTVRHAAASGTLTAVWKVGPDGDWWQTEYPVKTADDLPAAAELVAARQYVLAPERIAEMAGQVGENGVLALELPMRPYSDVLHTLLGWGDGLMLLMGEGRSQIQQMLAILDERLAGLAEQAARLPGDLLLAPDNLDGQYVSPRAFREFLAESYRRTADVGHATGKSLVVHVGGSARRILPLLAQAGVDGVEGVAGAPQGDATLVEARAATGPAFTLWGGIAQDYLVAERSEEEFEAAAREALGQARGDPRVILGVADRVPADAQWDRLCRLSEMAAEAG